MEGLTYREKLTCTVDEGAALLGISRPVMYELCHREDCAFTLRIGRRILISRIALEAWIAEQSSAKK